MNITDCDIDPELLRCRVCGAAVSAAHVRRNCRPGLGDRVASALDSVGITKARVQKLVGGPCRCPDRQAALNAAGAKYFDMSPGSTAEPG